MNFFSQIYNKLLRIAKATYFDEQIKLAKYDMKQTWKIMRKVMNNETGKEPIPDYFEINSKKINNKKEIVDSFNRFFSTIGSDISDKVPVSQTPYSQFLNRDMTKVFSLTL